MYGRIFAECYDTVLEANHRHNSRPKDKWEDSRLIITKKFWPEFMQKIFIQTEFVKPVVFLPTLYYYYNIEKK